MNEILDNLDHHPSQETNNLFVRIFRFFNQCSYYADPKGGRREGAWTLILGFILFPFTLLSVFIPIESLFFISFLIYPLTIIIFNVILLIGFLFGKEKALLKVKKHWFVMKYPTFSSKKKRLKYALYFYLILFGMFIIPWLMFFVLDIFNYYSYP